MYYSNGLEYIVGSSYSNKTYQNVSYFSKNTDDKPACENASHARVQLYSFKPTEQIIFGTEYRGKTQPTQYDKNKHYQTYITNHQFTPEIFLTSRRQKTRFIDDNNEARRIAEETFELMMPAKVKDFCGTENPKDFLVKQKLPSNISINVLPFDEFKALHSSFGAWSNGILGFSSNEEKKIFVRENHLDALMLIIGHEIGHVLTETLPNKHDEEAKAFAFSIEWAKTIKQHNIANLGSSIKDEIDFQPARNGLHDVALAFVDFMVKKGRKAMQLHEDLIKRYVSVFDRIY